MESIAFSPQGPAVSSRESRAGRRVTPRRGPSVVSFTAVLVVAGLGFGLVLGLPLVDGTMSEFHLSGGVAMFLGSTTGLIGTYLALVMVVLASRWPALERTLGQGGVIHWHRILAPWPIVLLSAHAVLLTLAYAEAARRGVWREVGVIVNTFPSMVTATVALGLMVVIGVISIRQIRTRISRESWWLVHLFMYAALILGFAHEVVLGPSFVGHPLVQWTWTGAWLLAAGLLVTFRIGMPVFRSMRHRLEVVEARPESPGVVSIILKGRALDRLVVSGGQFFEWRFLAPGMWWQAHPFSVSALPQRGHIRLTVKGVGEFTRALAKIKPGTKVGVEGPYGSFTAFARRRPQALLIAGGIGVTAIRTLVEDLPLKSRPVVVLRATREEDLVLANEIEEITHHRKGVVHRLLGSRLEVPLENIFRLVPDFKKRDIFVSGPEEFVAAVVAMAHRAGVAPDAVHQEAYSI